MRKAQQPTPIISDHSLTRFLTVVWLHLLRMAGRLLRGEAPHRDDLNIISRFVGAFLIIRAASIANLPSARITQLPASAPPGFARRKLPTPFALNRVALGAKLRRHLRGRTPLAHICALIRAILNINALAQALAKRFKRRLTRLSPLVLVRGLADARVSAVPASQARANDSS